MRVIHIGLGQGKLSLFIIFDCKIGLAQVKPTQRGNFVMSQSICVNGDSFFIFFGFIQIVIAPTEVKRKGIVLMASLQNFEVILFQI